MCALPATLTEELGHRTHFQQLGLWHKSCHLRPVLSFIGDVRDVPISATAVAGARLAAGVPRVTLSDSDEPVASYAKSEQSN